MITEIGNLTEKLAGISTDTKPTNVRNGSILVEMDTSKIFFFNEDDGQWEELESGTPIVIAF